MRCHISGICGNELWHDARDRHPGVLPYQFGEVFCGVFRLEQVAYL